MTAELRRSFKLKAKQAFDLPSRGIIHTWRKIKRPVQGLQVLFLSCPCNVLVKLFDTGFSEAEFRKGLVDVGVSVQEVVNMEETGFRSNSFDVGYFQPFTTITNLENTTVLPDVKATAQDFVLVDDQSKEGKRKSRIILQPKGTIAYEVANNDTLASIAAQFDTTRSELKKLNRLMSDVVFTGNTIYIPDKDYIPSDSSSSSLDSPPNSPLAVGGGEDGAVDSVDGGGAGIDRMGITADQFSRLYPDLLLTGMKPILSAAYRQNTVDEGVSRKGGHWGGCSGESDSEQFIKLSAKYITDERVEVSGVMLVTPNAVLFEADLPEEAGLTDTGAVPAVVPPPTDIYNMIAPMESIASITISHDLSVKRASNRSSDAADDEVFDSHSIHSGNKSSQPLASNSSAPASFLETGPTSKERHGSPSTSELGTATTSSTSEIAIVSTNTLTSDSTATTSIVVTDVGEKDRVVTDAESAVSRTVRIECTAKNFSDSLTNKEDIAATAAGSAAAANVAGKQVTNGSELLDGVVTEVNQGQGRADILETTIGAAEAVNRPQPEANRSPKEKKENFSETETSTPGGTSRMPGGSIMRNILRFQYDNILTGSSGGGGGGASGSPAAGGGGGGLAQHAGGVPTAMAHQSGGPDSVMIPPGGVKDAPSTSGENSTPTHGIVTRTFSSISSYSSSLVNLPANLFSRNQLDSKTGNSTGAGGAPGEPGSSPKEDKSDHSRDSSLPSPRAFFLQPLERLKRKKKDSSSDLEAELETALVEEDDTRPLYMCLKTGKIRTSAKTGPFATYIRTRLKPHYWFIIPPDKADLLYAFFVQWSPIYNNEEGGADCLTERGFVVVNPGGEGSSFEEGGGSTSSGGCSRRDGKKWEIVNAKEVRRMMSVAEIESLPLPELSEPSKIFSDEHIRELCFHLPARAEGCPWHLLYSSEKHGFSLNSMYRKMGKTDSSVLVVIKDDSNEVFGAMLPCSLKVSEHFYGTGESYLFTFYQTFKKYGWTGRNNYFIKGNTESLSVGAGEGAYGLWLDGDLYHGRTQSCLTYDNDLLTVGEDFVIKSVEVWCFS